MMQVQVVDQRLLHTFMERNGESGSIELLDLNSIGNMTKVNQSEHDITRLLTLRIGLR